MKNWFGYGFVFLSAACYAVLSIVMKTVYNTGLTDLTAIIIEAFLSTVLIWLVVVIGKNKAKVQKKYWLHLAAQGMIGGFGATMLFFLALARLGASLTTLLYFTFPAMVMIYHVLILKAKLIREQIISLFMVMIGILLTIDFSQLETGMITLGGLSMGIGAAVANAFISINGEKLLEQLETFVVTAWSFTFSFGMMLLVYQPSWIFSLEITYYQAVLLFLGAILTVTPVAAYLAGIRRVGSGNASIVSTLEIPIILLLAGWILGEALNIVQLTGAKCITLGVATLYYFTKD